jgi:ribose/xylose/arabinose/galactoside ABC-type transport system permease subunit
MTEVKETAQDHTPKSGSTAKNVARRILRHENTYLFFVLLALIAIVAFATDGLSITRANMANVMLQSSIMGVASVGQAFVILTAGIDLSVGGVGLLSSVLGSSMMTRTVYQNIVGAPVSVAIAVPTMILAAAAVGTINGIMVSRVGMPALIITLGMWQIANGLGFAICQGSSIGALPDSMAFLGSGSIGGIPTPVVVFFWVAAIGYFVLNYTPFGRSVYAVGGNPVNAWLSGIKTRRVTFMVYLISGILAGIAGVLITGRVLSASMRSLEGLELDTIGAVCVGGVSLMGGRGNLIGVILGVLIIGVINNGMSILGAGPDTQDIAKGLIIITAVAVDIIGRRRRG